MNQPTMIPATAHYMQMTRLWAAVRSHAFPVQSVPNGGYTHLRLTPCCYAS